MFSLPLIYEDASCIVINKPAGLAVQGGEKTSVSVDSILSGRQAQQFTERPHLVHRLDKETSGALLLAKDKTAAAYYTNAFAEKACKKEYRAICAVSASATNAASFPPNGSFTNKVKAHGELLAAVTRYKVLQHTDAYCYFSLQPETGRMHQLRQHLAQNGFPILGDDKYGDFKLNKRLRGEIKLKHMLLHSYQLQLKNIFGMPLSVTAELPDYFTFPPPSPLP
jgi:23S rRNA pseudouridine955/2504/2580 synthase